jgi:TFIIF-interacting CTD phosphatase-like protein
MIRDCPRVSLEAKLLNCKIVRPDGSKEVKKTKSPSAPVAKLLPGVRYRPCQLAVSLDLDETLIRTLKTTKGLSDFPEEERYSITLGKKKHWGVKRPGLDRFLDQIFEIAYPVFVFTASISPYAQQICSHIFQKQWPARIYTNQDCETEGHDLLRKPLTLITRDFPDLANLERLVAIDDRQSAYYSDERKGVIQIPRWEGKGEDNSLDQLIDYLKELRFQPGDLREHVGAVEWDDQIKGGFWG